MKKIVAVTSLAFLLTLGDMALSQPPSGGMRGSEGEMMNMMGQCPMTGMMNMMSQCVSMMGGQQPRAKMFNQCMAMMGAQPMTPGTQPQEKSGQSGESR